ncbi:hypothetical protein [Yeosuana marina]|uniref:hypothetical protein n=1 Tax=Yeosuana marina TaxID=1565536 RepID=UPI0030C84BA1
MDIEQINVRIRAKQEMINLEKDQDKKNELMHQMSVLNMRKEIANTKEKIKKMTN